MAILTSIVLSLTLLTLIGGIPVTTPPIFATTMAGCFHGGHLYHVGQSFGNVCSPCRCTGNGQVSCIAIDCAYGMCVDVVHDPAHCCPHCPNGANCKAVDGTIIKQGDVYHPDNYTACSCPTLHIGFGFGGRTATCI